jgi:hypothetical protein
MINTSTQAYAKINNNNNTYNNNNRRRKPGKMINNFTLNGKTYSIRLTNHAEQRLQQRNIDLYQVTGSILSLGQKTITAYAGSNRDIFILDKEHNFSIVCNISACTITIITVIDSIDCWIKNGTIAVKLQ